MIHEMDEMREDQKIKYSLGDGEECSECGPLAILIRSQVSILIRPNQFNPLPWTRTGAGVSSSPLRIFSKLPFVNPHSLTLPQPWLWRVQHEFQSVKPMGLLLESQSILFQGGTQEKTLKRTQAGNMKGEQRKTGTHFTKTGTKFLIFISRPSLIKTFARPNPFNGKWEGGKGAGAPWSKLGSNYNLWRILDGF